jgi:UDPglucose 6-dehydrogenase
VSGADALVIMTEWDAYKSPDFKELSGQLKDRVIFDGRNILEAAEARQAGLTYVGIGRSGE